MAEEVKVVAVDVVAVHAFVAAFVTTVADGVAVVVDDVVVAAAAG